MPYDKYRYGEFLRTRTGPKHCVDRVTQQHDLCGCERSPRQRFTRFAGVNEGVQGPSVCAVYSSAVSVTRAVTAVSILVGKCCVCAETCTNTSVINIAIAIATIDINIDIIIDINIDIIIDIIIYIIIYILNII